MKVDVRLSFAELGEVPRLARAVEAAGFDGLWSSEAIQNTATALTPLRRSSSLSRSAVRALQTVSIGPVNNPACCPVITATESGLARSSMRCRTGPALPKASF